jgi:hypothetical protein
MDLRPDQAEIVIFTVISISHEAVQIQYFHIIIPLFLGFLPFFIRLCFPFIIAHN